MKSSKLIFWIIYSLFLSVHSLCQSKVAGDTADMTCAAEINGNYVPVRCTGTCEITISACSA